MNYILLHVLGKILQKYFLSAKIITVDLPVYQTCDLGRCILSNLNLI